MARRSLPAGAQFVRATRVKPDTGGLVHRGGLQLGCGAAAGAPRGRVQRRQRPHGARGAARLAASRSKTRCTALEMPRGQRAHGNVRRARAHAARDRRLRAYPGCAGERAARRAPALPGRAARGVRLRRRPGCGQAPAHGPDRRGAGRRHHPHRRQPAQRGIRHASSPTSSAGIAPSAPHVVEHDRALAIRLALERSAADDVVLIAGKGHEGYQITGSERREFRDQAVVSAELARLPA